MKLVHVAQIGVGVCAGLLLGGMVTASAAQLGTLTAQSLGTSATVVAACDTDGIDASWDSSSPTSPVFLGNAAPASSTYTVSRLILTGIAGGCNTQNYKVAIAGTTGTALQTFTGTISGTTLTLTVAPVLDSKNVGQIIVLIYE